MSHYTLCTIGIKEEDLATFMERYSEHREVEPYISTTKKELLEMGEERIRERRAPSEITTPEEYYNFYTEGEILDEEGNLLSTYNPESRWDYYRVMESYTAKAIKELIRNKLENYSSDIDELVWRVIVEGREDLQGTTLSTGDRFMLFWGMPSKEEMIRLYGNLDGYIAHRKKAIASLSYTVMTPDGEWHEPGTVGWWGTSSASAEDESQWNANFYDRFIKDLPDDTTVMLIDCHI